MTIINLNHQKCPDLGVFVTAETCRGYEYRVFTSYYCEALACVLIPSLGPNVDCGHQGAVPLPSIFKVRYPVDELVYKR